MSAGAARGRDTRGPLVALGAGRVRSAAVALLDALRALASVHAPGDAPRRGPRPSSADVLEAHGLAPLASSRLERARLGAGVRRRPGAAARPLPGVVNDDVLKLVTLRGVLRTAGGAVPVVLLEVRGVRRLALPAPRVPARWATCAVAIRPADRAAAASRPRRRGSPWSAAEHGGRAAHAHRRPDRARDSRTRSGRAGRRRGGRSSSGAGHTGRSDPWRRGRSPEEALLATVAEQAGMGLFAPLVTFVDLRELVRLDGARPGLRLLGARRRARGSARALRGGVARRALFPGRRRRGGERAGPRSGLAERVAVERVVEAAKDPPGSATCVARTRRRGWWWRPQRSRAMIGSPPRVSLRAPFFASGERTCKSSSSARVTSVSSRAPASRRSATR